MAKTYVYTNASGEPFIAYSHAMGRDIPRYQYYEDRKGERVQLDALKETVVEGDTIIVGTIIDFLVADLKELLATLEFFSGCGVQIISRLEPRYNIELYRDIVGLADNLARFYLGLPPE